jgi:hypothetical protein
LDGTVVDCNSCEGKKSTQLHIFVFSSFVYFLDDLEWFLSIKERFNDAGEDDAAAVQIGHAQFFARLSSLAPTEETGTC